MPWSRTRVVTLVVCALITVACSGSTPEAAPSSVVSPAPSAPPSTPSPTPRHSSSPSPSPTGPKKHAYVTIDDIQAVSPETAVVTYEACVATRANETCRSHLARTTDLGATWEDIGPRRPTRYAYFNHPRFLDADRGWVALTDCTGGWARIYRTFDGGATWRHVAVQSPTCSAGAGIDPLPIDEQTGYYTWAEPTGSFTRLYRSTDGGATFSRAMDLPSSGPLTTPPRFLSPTVAWLGGDNGGVARTDDGGITWDARPVPVPACCEHDARTWDSPTFDGSVGVVPVFAQRHQTWHVQFDRSADGGATWLAGPSVQLSGRYAPSVGVVDATTWWAASRGHTVKRTTDAGASWTTTRGPEDLEIYEIEPIDGNSAWLRASGGEHTWLFLTGDGGRTWERLHPEPRALTTIATLPRAISSLVAGSDGSVYALGTTGNAHEWISRIDPRTGVERTTVTLPGGGFYGSDALAVFRGSVWYAGQDPRNRDAPTTVFRLDALDLRIQDVIEMGAPPTAVASTTAGVWVAAGRTLTMFSAAGARVREVDIGGRVTHMAVDPTGTRLYVATDTPTDRASHVIFEERLASTGALLASSTRVGYADLGGPTGVTPTSDGVWVTSPTGMLASVQLLRADDLSPAGSFEGSNTVSTSYVADALWISDAAAELTCADPGTGDVRERLGHFPKLVGFDGVVEARGSVYASSGRTLMRISPASRCLAG